MTTLSSTDIVVITGATGYIGRVLTRQLLEKGCTLHILARPSSDTLEFESHPQIKIFRGDITDPETVRRACAGCHYVVHLAGSFREAKSSEEHHRKVHVTGVQLMAQAAYEQPEFRRFVHISTIGVHGHIDEPPANEESRFNPGDAYQRTKAEAELWIRDFAAQKNMPLTVIRPASVMGPGDKRLLKLFKMAKLPIVPLLGYSRGLLHFIHVEDLARCIIAATDSSLPSGNVYICGNREPIPTKDIIIQVAQMLGRKPHFLRIPAWPFFVLGFIVEKVCVPLGVEPPIYRRRVAFFTKDRAFDTTRMQKSVFGPLMQYDNRLGIADTANWYLQKGWL